MQQLRYNANRFFLIFTLLGLLSLTIMPSIVHSQDLSMIRVLLLNGKFSNEHLILFKNSKGIQLSTQDDTPYNYLHQTDQYIGIQFARYQLEMIETRDSVAAKAVVGELSQITDRKLNPSIEVIEKSNQKYYRVLVGGFDTLTELNEFKQFIKEKTSLTGKDLGPLNLAAGGFPSLEDARTTLRQLKDNGFNSYLTQVLVNGTWENQIYVGEASTAQELAQLKQAIIAKFPGLNLVEANDNSYVITKEGVFTSGSTFVAYPILIFSPTQLIKVNPFETTTPTQVKERTYLGQSNSYRGEITFQLYKTEIALVNTLSTETYLHSVVGSEMPYTWPLEALKSQAIAARTFAYMKQLNPRNEIANIFDSTDDQAYYGTSKEADGVIEAVNETKGIVVLYNGKPVNTFYSSNAGGMTSSGSEVWGNEVAYTTVKESPDATVLESAKDWYRIIRSDGQTGYIRNDYIEVLDKVNKIGYKYGIVIDGPVNFRSGPSNVRFPIMTTLPNGEEIVILDTVKENNAYSWIAGPFSADYITENVNKHQLSIQASFTSPILDLRVAERGPSGRVILLANGNIPIPVKYPDYYRSLLGSLPNAVQSAKFDIEQLGRIEVLGANGKRVSLVNQKNEIYVASANNTLSPLTTTNESQQEYMIMDVNNKVKVATKDQAYLIRGTGLGHGLGMSQWGAKGLAENGYTYQQILKYYYNNIEVKQIY